MPEIDPDKAIARCLGPLKWEVGNRAAKASKNSSFFVFQLGVVGHYWSHSRFPFSNQSPMPTLTGTQNGLPSSGIVNQSFAGLRTTPASAMNTPPFPGKWAFGAEHLYDPRLGEPGLLSD